MLCAAYPGGGTMGTGYTSGWRWFGDGKQQGCNLNLQAVVPARVMAHTFNGDNKATSLAPSYSNGRFSEKLPSLRTCYGVCPWPIAEASENIEYFSLLGCSGNSGTPFFLTDQESVIISLFGVISFTA
jgi:hypothetical protein